MNCPRPRVSRTGDIECPACGLMWGVDDPEPRCSRLIVPLDRREISRQVAERELAKIRHILGVAYSTFS